jgi:ATP synthase I chain
MGHMTLLLGAAAAVIAGARYSLPAGVGLLLGTLLAWLNLRWLDQAGVALSQLAQAREGAPRPQIPQATWVKFFARYALMAVALYATVTFSPVPPVSVVGGLLMLGAAAMVVGLYEVFAGTS